MTEPTRLPDDLQRPLGRLRRRGLLLACLRGAGLASTGFLLAALVVGWTDLVVELPSNLRLALLLLMSAAAGIVPLWLLVEARLRANARRLADLLDRAGRTGGQIRAGVELAETWKGQAPSALTADLTRRAIAASSALAERQNPAAAVPARPAFRPWYTAAAVVVFLLGAWIVWPDLVSAQARRVFDPTGDHPRHGPYRFEIQPSAMEVVYGEPFSVEVRVHGAETGERFDWVVEQPGRKPWRIPLIARNDGAHAGNLSAVVGDFVFHVVGEKGRSPDLPIKVLLTPEVRGVYVRLDFPAYTGLAPYEGKLPEGGPAGVRGTKVTLILESNRPLKGGALTVRPAAEKEEAPPREIAMTPLKPEDPRAVAGSFEIDADLRFAALIEDVGGLRAREPVTGRCLLVPDRAPTVALAEPPPVSYATPDVDVPVAIEAEDDFGIAGVKLYRSLNGSREIAQDIPLDGADPRMPRLGVELPLSQWSLAPGDEIALYASVWDNDPAGAKAAMTPVHRITIITKELYRELLRQQETIDDLNDRYQPWLSQLAELRKQVDQARKSGEAKDAEAVKKTLREMVERLQDQLKEPPVFDADLQFSKELQELLETLQQAQKEAEDDDYEGLNQLLGDEQEDLDENLKLPLETLVKLYRLIEDETLYAVLTQIQEDLAKRLERFKGKEHVGDPEEQRELRALLDEQQQVRDALRRLLQDIRDHAAQLPREDERFKELVESAERFATEVQESDLDRKLGECEQALAGNKGADAAERARDAAERMKEFLEKCCGQQGLGEQTESRLRKFAPKMVETVNQLLGGRGLPKLGQRGQGRTGGFRSGKSNVGLYGSKQRKASGGGRSDKKNQDGVPIAGGGKMDDVEGFGMLQEFGDGDSTGVPYGALPGRYRGVVRDFYRKVVDDWGKKK
ncbi:MAG: hypothetical protein M5U26_03910 [Planctomycetota bacterium]|nr:hypothetical protein [Planctomycetota bacterium]